jgi:hypothetical protein
VERRYNPDWISGVFRQISGLRGHPLSHSEIQAALGNDNLVDISTTGRKTGKTRRFEIWSHYLDEQVHLTGKPAPRDWYANMIGNKVIPSFHSSQTSPTPDDHPMIE